MQLAEKDLDRQGANTDPKTQRQQEDADQG